MIAQELSDELSEEEKAALFVQCICEELAEEGLIKHGRFRASRRGLDSFRLLRATGFRPTSDEIGICCALLFDKEDVEHGIKLVTARTNGDIL